LLFVMMSSVAGQRQHSGVPRATWILGYWHDLRIVKI
jgi:hypothetical protein